MARVRPGINNARAAHSRKRAAKVPSCLPPRGQFAATFLVQTKNRGIGQFTIGVRNARNNAVTLATTDASAPHSACIRPAIAAPRVHAPVFHRESAK